MIKAKKIAVLHPYVNKVGGAVKMMIYLADMLNKDNQVMFYTFSYDSKLFEKSDISFEILSFFKNGILRYISFLIIAYKIRNNDIIIIGNSPMHFVGVLSKILFFSKAKIIWWNHHFPWYYDKNIINKSTNLKRWIESACLKYIDVIVSNSNYLKGILENIFNREVKILTPVLDEEFLGNPLLNSLPNIRERGSNVIFSYGRWVGGKNVEMIFAVYDNLKDEVSDLVLNVGGEGDELEYFKSLYKDDNNVNFLGILDSRKIVDNLSKSNVLLFPSKIDSFGMVIIESMSIGVPVVSYNVGGACDLILDSKNGFLVQTDEQFISKTKELLLNKEMQKDFSKLCLDVTKRYNGDYFKEKLSGIIK